MELQHEINGVKEQARLGAIRWLHSIDLNPCSPTYGIADREYWSWKTKDFANGTWQGGIAGVLDSRKLLDLTETEIEKLVLATVKGTRTIQRSNGSFEEAYPYESSYAVTALVLFNLLYSRLRYPHYFGQDAGAILNEIISKGVAFLRRTPETHGLISNHRATADLALFMAESNSADGSAFLSLQKTEGWFPEYGGADPGYQTLLAHYIVACGRALSLPQEFHTAILRSNEFLRHFCFPDGSFAGEIGSRGTSIVYPGGLWDLDFKATPLTTWFFNRHAPYIGAVGPTNADNGNFVPVFNSWALAFQLSEEQKTFPAEPVFFATDRNVWDFPQAELMGVNTSRAHLVLSLKNGAIRKCIQDSSGIKDESVVGFSRKENTPHVTVIADSEITDRRIKYTLEVVESPFMLNNAWRASLLRALAFAVYLFPWAQRILKQVLSYVVMNRKGTSKNSRLEVTIDLVQESLPVTVNFRHSEPLLLKYGFNRHMASANTFDPRAL